MSKHSKKLFHHTFVGIILLVRTNCQSQYASFAHISYRRVTSKFCFYIHRSFAKPLNSHIMYIIFDTWNWIFETFGNHINSCKVPNFFLQNPTLLCTIINICLILHGTFQQSRTGRKWRNSLTLLSFCIQTQLGGVSIHLQVDLTPNEIVHFLHFNDVHLQQVHIFESKQEIFLLHPDS